MDPMPTRVGGGSGLSGEGIPAFPPPLVVQQINPSCCQCVGFVSGATGQGLHRDEKDTVLGADPKVDMHPGWSWGGRSRDLPIPASSPPPLPQGAPYSVP